ncbi:MAG: CHASE2 domain-containing protein [Spirochaetales bacterium]|nr:CHASE2 domain-containing protein [Spirochaetales bacterium]
MTEIKPGAYDSTHLKKLLVLFVFISMFISCSDKTHYRMVSEMNRLHPIEIIYFDSDTERELGPFPVKRSVYGELIEKLESRDPALVILKFFLDSESEEDEALAEVIGRYDNVYTQASLLLEPVTEPTAGVLDKMAVGSDESPVTTEPVELVVPNSVLFDSFAGVGLVDFTGNKGQFEDFPVFTEYQGRVLPSLALISAAFLVDEDIRIDGESLRIGLREIALRDSLYTLDLSGPEALYPVHSMIDVLNGDPRKFDFNGKVIIVFIDNPEIRSIKSEYGKRHNPAEIVADSINTLLKDLEDGQ